MNGEVGYPIPKEFNTNEGVHRTFVDDPNKLHEISFLS